jgi:hypothetical protein
VTDAIQPKLAEFAVEIVQESWSEYLLQDGTTIRTRPILIKVVFPQGKPAEGSQAPMALAAVPIIAVFPAEDRRGPRAQSNPTQEQIQQAKSTPVRAEHTKEAWNYYRILGLKGALKVKMDIASVSRAEGLFTTEGEQVYSVGWSVAGGQISEEQLASDLYAPPSKA